MNNKKEETFEEFEIKYLNEFLNGHAYTIYGSTKPGESQTLLKYEFVITIKSQKVLYKVFDMICEIFEFDTEKILSKFKPLKYNHLIFKLDQTRQYPYIFDIIEFEYFENFFINNKKQCYFISAKNDSIIALQYDINISLEYFNNKSLQKINYLLEDK